MLPIKAVSDTVEAALCKLSGSGRLCAQIQVHIINKSEFFKFSGFIGTIRNAAATLASGCGGCGPSQESESAETDSSLNLELAPPRARVDAAAIHQQQFN